MLPVEDPGPPPAAPHRPAVRGVSQDVHLGPSRRLHPGRHLRRVRQELVGELEGDLGRTGPEPPGSSARSPRPRAAPGRTHPAEPAVPHEGGGPAHLVEAVEVPPRRRRRRRAQLPPQRGLPVAAEGRCHGATGPRATPGQRSVPPASVPGNAPSGGAGPIALHGGAGRERTANGKSRPPRCVMVYVVPPPLPGQAANKRARR